MQEMQRRSVLAMGLAAPAFISWECAAAQNSTADSPEQRLRDRGIVLPSVPAPAANYVPYTRIGNLLFLSGVAPRRPNGPSATGKVGGDVSVDEAYQHARLAGLVLLAVTREAVGSLDKVLRIGRVEGRINAVPDFTEHAKVLNGCSDLFVEVFGERGRHARSVFGASTPFGITVYIEAVVEVA